LRDVDKHLVHTLHRAGYSSALIGLQHIRRDAADIGYKEVADVGSLYARDVVPVALECLDRPPRTPFFLSVGFAETHRGEWGVYPEPKAPYDGRYVSVPAPLPDDPVVRKDLGGFLRSVKSFDEGVGRILARLEANGLSENTLVICTTDHGPAFPRMKCNLTDAGTGIMLIMRGPGGLSGGRVIDELVSNIDVFPTVCELLGLDAPGWLQGRSLLPLLRGEDIDWRDAVYSEVNYHCSYEPQRSVRTHRWKYIRRYVERVHPFLANCDPSPSKDLLVMNGWADATVEAEQLYDLVLDPHEANSVAGHPEHGATLAMLRTQLDRWMEETGDPLLEGIVPRPGGAEINPDDDLCPYDIYKES